MSLISADASVIAIAPVGGFLAQLPKDQTLPSWTYSTITENPEYTLLRATNAVLLRMRRMQIDCYGYQGADVISLAAAINKVIDGFQGVLTDPDHTPVYGIFLLDRRDFYDPDSRTYREMLEYEIRFTQ